MNTSGDVWEALATVEVTVVNDLTTEMWSLRLPVHLVQDHYRR
jgi:hypothetical protein